MPTFIVDRLTSVSRMKAYISHCICIPLFFTITTIFQLLRMRYKSLPSNSIAHSFQFHKSKQKNRNKKVSYFYSLVGSMRFITSARGRKVLHFYIYFINLLFAYYNMYHKPNNLICWCIRNELFIHYK